MLSMVFGGKILCISIIKTPKGVFVLLLIYYVFSENHTEIQYGIFFGK